MPEYAFGDRVSVSHHLVRKAEYPQPGQRTKTWKPVAFLQHEGGDAYQRPRAVETPVDVIVIGKRTLSNGEASWGGYDDPITFTPRERFSAYLVVANLRSAPFYVLEEHISERTQTYEVGQHVTHIGHPGVGIIISTDPQEGRDDPYVVVLWGEDEIGWLTGGWFLSENPPLRVVDTPAPEIARLLVRAALGQERR